MSLAVFDLDHTILEGDSDSNWLIFLAGKNLVSKETVLQKNAGFYRDYMAGKLNYNAYAEFAFGIISNIPLARLKVLRRAYFKEKILPMIRVKAVKRINAHRKSGHKIVISTATNDFIAYPVVRYLKADDLLATSLEKSDDGFTGKYHGIPNFREGKVTNFLNWLKTNHEHQLATTYFYSDSINDLPLLQIVGYPRVVNGDAELTAKAEEFGWRHCNFSS